MNSLSPSFPARYSGVSIGTRLFLTLRWYLTPYSQMACHLPPRGRILDVGCGHGLLSLAIASGHPEREILGIDHDQERILAAMHAARGLPNLRFEKGSILSLPSGPFEGISAIDVMHYFEPGLQEKIFSDAYSQLTPGGVFIVREVDPEGGGLASAFNRFYEKLATATGFTQAAKPGLHFRTPAQWATTLERAGFKVSVETCSSRLFADILYVCQK